MARLSNKLTVRNNCFITAACVVGRTFFQFIPNVQPITAIFILVSFYKGLLHSFLIVLLTIVVTNIYMGMGLWTLIQIFAYSVIIILSYGLSRIPWFILLAAAAGICSFYRLPVWFYNSLRGYANLWNQRFLAVLFARNLF